MKSIFFFFLCGLIGARIAAQVTAACPEIPEQYEWKNAADYTNDRENVKNVLRWLCRTPYGEAVQQRSAANAYVMEWIAGSPELTLDVYSKVIPEVENNAELLFSVIHGMALYQMDHPAEKSKIKLHTKGLEVLAQLCEQSSVLSKERGIKLLLRAYHRGKIKEYTIEKLAGTP